MDVEAAEDMALLPAAQEAVDDQGDGDHQHRPPGEDQRVAGDEQDHARNPEEDVTEVQHRDEVVDAGHELGQHARLVARGVAVQALEHAARPT
jgi:hypothetical protein